MRGEVADISSRRSSQALLWWCFVAAFAVGLVWRMPGWERAFWVDEVFTGAIALQPSFRGLIDDCLNELGGPAYYGLAWLWAKIFGVSDFSLRAISLLCSVAAPAFLAWRGHPDRTVRLVWGGLSITLFQLVFYSHEARSYSFLFLLGSLQAVACGAMLRRPHAGAAYAWAATSALMTLTHYFTIPLTGLQWLAMVGLLRGRALRFWPAMLLFVPALAWMGVHLPIVLRFSNPAMAWQTMLGLSDVTVTLGAIFGEGAWWKRSVAAIMVLAAVTSALDAGKALTGKKAWPYAVSDAAVVAASAGAIAVILAYGFLRPSFTPRYLVPCMPGLLLALAIWSGRMRIVSAAVPALLLAAFATQGAVTALELFRRPEAGVRATLQWQHAATALMDTDARHVAFLWDDPLVSLAPSGLMGRVGGFFFDRAASGIRTTPVMLPPRGDFDPNVAIPALLDASRRGAERDGFIWIWYPPGKRLRAGAEPHPPRLDELSKRFACRNFGGDSFLIALGCIRRAM